MALCLEGSANLRRGPKPYNHRRMNATLLNRILTVLAFAGIFVASYLTMAHWIGANVACGISDGCGKVATSGYAFIPFGGGHDGKFGIPVALFGALAYAVLAALAVVRSIKGDASGGLTKLGTILSGIGFLGSAGLMYLSFFVIKGTCIWCVASASIMTLTFIAHLILSSMAVKPAHFSIPFLTVVGVASFAALFFATAKLDPPLKQVDLTPEQLTPPDPHTLGDPNASLVIIEFIDLTCGHCRESYGQIKEMLAKKAKFQVVFRHFPLRGMQGHEMALPAAVISELVAEKGKFIQFLDMVYGTAAQELSVEKLLQYATTLGVDRKEAEKRMVDDKDPAFQRMKRDIDLADELGILSTPTYYIGERGKKVIPAKAGTFGWTLQQPQMRKLWDPTFVESGK